MRDDLCRNKQQLEPGHMHRSNYLVRMLRRLSIPLEIAPQIVGQHHNLEVHHVALETLRRNVRQNFAN